MLAYLPMPAISSPLAGLHVSPENTRDFSSNTWDDAQTCKEQSIATRNNIRARLLEAALLPTPPTPLGEHPYRTSSERVPPSSFSTDARGMHAQSDVRYVAPGFALSMLCTLAASRGRVEGRKARRGSLTPALVGRSLTLSRRGMALVATAESAVPLSWYDSFVAGYVGYQVRAGTVR